MVKDSLKEFINNINRTKIFIVLLISRIPYLVIFYPGLVCYSSTVSIAQYYGIPTFATQLSSVQGATISNHHPAIYAYIYSALLKFGELLVNQNFGYFLIVFLQVVISIAVITYVLTVLKDTINKKYFIIVLLIYALFPIFPVWEIAPVKDVCFSLSILMLCVELYQIIKTDFNILKKISFIILFIVTCLCCCFTKSQGAYILIVVSIIITIKYRKKILKPLIIMLSTSIFYLFIFCSLILPSIGVAPIGKQESIGFMLQQTARYVVSNAEEVTKEEQAVISKILPYEEIPNRYNPTLQDDIKFMFNQQVTQEDLMNYYKVWFTMFFKHPETYIKATFLNSKGFFFGGEDSTFFPNYLEENPIFTENQEFNIYHTNPIYYGVGESIKNFSNLPVIRELFKSPLYVWITIISSIIFFIKKREDMVAFMLPLLVCVLTLIVTPTVFVRYVMMMILATPALIFVLLSIIKPDKQIH